MTLAQPPLLESSRLDTPIAWRQGQPISRTVFLRHVERTVRHLPPARFILNLCEDRYHFMVAFAAVGVNGQTNLLPSSRASLHLQQLAGAYSNSRQITDRDLVSWLERDATKDTAHSIPSLSSTQVMAIAFTSGSTGDAKPNPKSWGELISGAWQAQQRFGFDPATALVATAPPQHMYGLETSIMTPLVSGVSIDSGRPFFPDDVRAALARVPAPRVLITTPVHLHACVQADLRWPEVRFLISATAPLSPTLATQAEQVFDAPVLEIYGCTEAGSIASRRTLDGDRWRLYRGFQLDDRALSGAHLPEPVLLNDQIEKCSATEFKLLGRCEDVINVAGKRSSLAYLNHQLNEITGVVEGIFVLPDVTGTKVQRLMALVVAPHLGQRQLLTALADRLDPVFLPRPLIKVTALPRNETGKITREAVLTLVTQLHPSAITPHEP
jgi:acyl-coenzyme A synthetase/AMP-(fatty) acid ligase